MPFYVYVLTSTTTGRRYIGQTDDLDRRLGEHNDPSHNPRKFTTRQAGSWLLIYHEEYSTRGAAMAREKWLKSGVGRFWLKGKMAGDNFGISKTP